MVGETTFNQYASFLKEVLGFNVKKETVTKNFRFGNDGVLTALFETMIPIAVQDCHTGLCAWGHLKGSGGSGRSSL
eukprot:6939140-Prorocentrum_lima.AAC.1